MKNQTILSQQNKLIEHFKVAKSQRTTAGQSATNSHKTTIQQTEAEQADANKQIGSQITTAKSVMISVRRDLTHLPNRKSTHLQMLLEDDNLLPPPTGAAESLAEARTNLEEAVSLLSEYTRNFKLMREEYANWRQHLIMTFVATLVLSIIAILIIARNWDAIGPYFYLLILVGGAITIYQKRKRIRDTSAWQYLISKSTELWSKYAPIDRIKQRR